MNLLVGVGPAIADRHDQGQQFRVLLGNFREDLDEIERPGLLSVLLCVRKAVEPRLKLVEQQHDRLLPRKFEHQFVRRDVSLGWPHAFPFAADVVAVGMLLEEDTPQEFVALTIEAFADYQHVDAEG